MILSDQQSIANERLKMHEFLLPKLMLKIADAQNIETALQIAVQQICQDTDWDYGEVWIPNADRTYLQCSQPGFATESPAISNLRAHTLEFIFPPNIGWPGRLWVSKKSQWYADVSQLSNTVFPRVELAKQVGIKAGFGLPIIINKKVIGVLLFFMFKSISQQSSSLKEIYKISPQLTMLLHQKKTEEELQDTTEKYRSIFENAVEGIFQTTADGRYLTVNPMLAKIYGYDSPAEMMENLTDIEHQLYVDPQRRAEFRRLLEIEDAVWGFESEIYRKDGKIIWISESARTLHNASGQAIGYEGTVVDITQRKQAEAELLKRDRLLEAIALAMNELLLNQNHQEAVNRGLATLGIAAAVHRVYICINYLDSQNGDRHNNRHRAQNRTQNRVQNSDRIDRAAERTLVMDYEWTADGVSSAKTANRLTIPEDSRIFSDLSQGIPVRGFSDRMSPGDRQVFGYPDVISSLFVPIIVQGKFFGYVGFDDCQTVRSWSKSEESILVAIAGSIGGAIQRHHQETLIHHQAFHDLLTGLPNRQHLEKYLPKILADAQENQQTVALMFIDLDRFKTINDTLGHPVGDRLLQIAAERLKYSIREHDMIIRWGGDEFIIILNKLIREIDASDVAQRIVSAIQESFQIEHHQLHVSCSIGIALYPKDGIDPQTLMQNADLALYRVKETGRNGYEFYSPYMNSQIPESLLLEKEAEDALKQQQFLLSYQPLVNPKTNKLDGMEALIRWNHPDRGLLDAKKFIPLLDERSILRKLGRWVLENACKQNSVWQKIAWPRVKVWVNLSSQEFQQPNLLQIIIEVLQETGLNPKCLGLEINETTAMKDLEFTSKMLYQFNQMEISVGLDNFGSGFVSLNALKNLPFERIKLDRSFVKHVATNPQDLSILKTMIDLGHQFSFNVVVQGIETEAQQEVVSLLDCEAIQGELLSPPLFVSDATRLFELAI